MFNEAFWILILFLLYLWTLSNISVNHLVENLILKFAVLGFCITYLVTRVCAHEDPWHFQCSKINSVPGGRLANKTQC